VGRRPGARGQHRPRAALDHDQAMTLAFRLLARRARSESEVASALDEAGASRRLARGVLGRLRALGYVDDRKLAAECVERGKDRGYGSLRIQEQLRRLEIDERIVERAALEGREERRLARRLLTERFGATELADRRTAARAARFLAGRGFPAEVIDSLFDSWE
jgi:regulatory protein